MNQERASYETARFRKVVFSWPAELNLWDCPGSHALGILSSCTLLRCAPSRRSAVTLSPPFTGADAYLQTATPAAEETAAKGVVKVVKAVGKEAGVGREEEEGMGAEALQQTPAVVLVLSRLFRAN
jgi:hypothetical protein